MTQEQSQEPIVHPAARTGYTLTDKGIDATEHPVMPAQVPVVHAEKGTRLEQLHATYAVAKAAADDAAAQLKAITDAIKLEATQAAPEGSPRIDLVGEAGPTLRLTWTESWRLDSRRLKSEDPETYVRYAKKSGTWVLKALGGGDRS